MDQKRLNLYLIDIKYVRNLAKADDHFMSISPQTGKERRSSPKPKHKSMKNDVDFTKILDGEKLIGVLNFNNMIPVDESCIIPLNLQITGEDDGATRHYKKMAAKQLDWCQHNRDAIIKKANKLYLMVQSDKVSGLLKRRCCNFKVLENVLQRWKNTNSLI